MVVALCKAPKDRSADLLYSIAQFDSALSGFRSMLDGKSDTERLHLLAQRSLSLYERAALVLHIVNSRGKVTGDSVDDLLRCFAGLGVSDTLLAMIKVSAYKAQEPMCLMMMPLWLEQRIRIDRPSGKASTYAASKPPWLLENGIPLVALDGFTRLGRKAIARFTTHNEEVRACVEALPKQHVAAAMRLAVFYADSAVTYPTLNWQHQREVQTRGIAADFAGINTQESMATALVDAVRDNLDHLNAIRRELLVNVGAAAQTGLHAPET